MSENPKNSCFVDSNIWLYAMIKTSAPDNRQAKSLLSSQEDVIVISTLQPEYFHINLYICAIAFFFLIFMLIDIPLLFLLAIASFIMPIIAIRKVFHNPKRPYYYPFIIRLV